MIINFFNKQIERDIFMKIFNRKSKWYKHSEAIEIII